MKVKQSWKLVMITLEMCKFEWFLSKFVFREAAILFISIFEFGHNTCDILIDWLTDITLLCRVRDLDQFNLEVLLEDSIHQEKVVNQLELALDRKKLNKLLSVEKWHLWGVKSNKNAVDLRMIIDADDFLHNRSNRRLWELDQIQNHCKLRRSRHTSHQIDA